MRSAILRRPMLILLCAAAPLSLNAGEPERVREMLEAPEALEAVGTLGAPRRAAAEGAAEPPARPATPAASPLEAWLAAPPRMAVRSEVSGASKAWRGLEDLEEIPEPDSSTTAAGDLGVSARAVWSETARGHEWRLELDAAGDRAGHEVSVELPILSRRHRVFTPSEHGTISLDFHPTFRPAPYGHLGWSSGRWYVMPLVSVLDEEKDEALTIAIPPDENIPHLQVEWTDARILKLTLAHRALGGGAKDAVRIRFCAHAADHRSTIDAYRAEFPRYFRPVLPRGPYEGAFWYHHIHDHPDFAEMARQNIRFIWMSFWFTHLGEYLPDAKEWEPYTYARWWKLGETMSDAKILAFIREIHEHGIGAYAYFNVTEYGGAGGRGGDAAEADRLLREELADALMKDERGAPIPTWEGSYAMNAGRRYALFPRLAEQVRRHLERLPAIDGFLIDRLDWASRIDHGHADGRTMIADRDVENMVWAVRDGVDEVCRQAHAAGKRVFVNQFWRIEVLRDVDGYCHESDFVRGLGYLSPSRPVSAWHHRRPYSGDLLLFEAQLKSRLQFAVLPQMIAHEFPISQQAPDPEAADLLEIYAPLFAALDGKEQVLLPRCVRASGANDANLFLSRAGRYAIPLTSRTRFLSRGVREAERASIRLRVPDAAELRWAHVIRADGAPERAELSRQDGEISITVAGHRTASMVIAGKGDEPPLPAADDARLASLRERLVPAARAESADAPAPPPGGKASRATLTIRGTHLGDSRSAWLLEGGEKLGPLRDGATVFEIQLGGRGSLGDRPVARIASGDEGTWFLVEEIEQQIEDPSGRWLVVGRWTPGDAADVDRDGTMQYRLAPARAEAGGEDQQQEAAAPAGSKDS